MINKKSGLVFALVLGMSSFTPQTKTVDWGAIADRGTEFSKGKSGTVVLVVAIAVAALVAFGKNK